MNIDFSRIRAFDGSQDGGFEELICQLAHLDPPNSACSFERKEGAGGDAGVECFWKLKNGKEHAWQAKYFMDRIEDSQWGQINESVEKALERHPNLVEYYVCIPQDLPDSRKKGKGGKPVKSARDKWNEYHAAWVSLAEQKGMKVQFHLWGKHEILLKLSQTKSSRYAGIAHYWFNELTFTQENFKKNITKSKNALGERFTPEFNVNLPIAEIFEGLGRTKFFYEDLYERISRWLQIANIIKNDIENIKKEANDFFQENFSEHEFEEKFRLNINVISSFDDVYFFKNYEKNIHTILEKLKLLINFGYEIQEKINNLDKNDKIYISDKRNNIYKYIDTTRNLKKYFESTIFESACTKQLLLIGEPGIGKSHLLCDISLSRLENNLPTIFVLGQHYQGGNPVDFLKRELDLINVEDSTFFSALNACGEAYKTNVLIIIDAINEGKYNNEWQDWLSGFLSEIVDYDNISIIISCRSTYVDYLIPEDVVSNITKETHTGFKGYEHRASSIYLNKHGISKPSVPILPTEFTNPLFLKTCCQAIKKDGLKEFPKGLDGLVNIFEFYIASAQRRIAIVKKYRNFETVVKNALLALAERLFPNEIFGVNALEAIEIINSVDTRSNIGESLYDLMLHEGVISEDIFYDYKSKNNTDAIPVVRFTYERLSDYLIARKITEKVEENSIKSFIESNEFKILTSGSYYKYLGILSAINIIFAEKFKLEFIEYLPEKMDDEYFFSEVFVKTLVNRSASSFTGRTLQLFNNIPKICYEDNRIDILIALSTEPNHILNGFLLNRFLKKLDLPIRDHIWSIHIANSDFVEEEHDTESNLRSIIEWALSDAIKLAQKDRLYLCALTLGWVFSTTNRRLRDDATKAVANILCQIPDKIIDFIENFYQINDPYIDERVYASVYGALTNINDFNCCEKIINWILEYHFINKEIYPHILLRDYLVSILLWAKYKGFLGSEIDVKEISPPYHKKFILKIPQVPKANNKIYRSVMGSISDFSNYGLNAIDQITITELGQDELRTGFDEKLLLAENINSPELKQIFTNEEELRLIKLAQEKEIWSKVDFEKVLAEIQSDISKKVSFSMKDSTDNENEAEKTELDLFLEENPSNLSPEIINKINVIKKLSNDRVVTQSKLDAKKWIYQRAIDLGWDAKLFDDFESYLPYEGRGRPAIERIGKKYQRIAYHEYLAYLIDCYQIKSQSYLSYSSTEEFLGSWQLSLRDIDPTLFIRTTYDQWWNSSNRTWWQPITMSFTESMDLQFLKDWLWNKENIPDLKNALVIQDDNLDEWYALAGFVSFRMYPKKNKDRIPYQDFWYRINPLIISTAQLDKFKKAIGEQELCNPDLTRNSEIGYQSFVGEYFWHPSVKDILEENEEGSVVLRLDGIDDDIDAFNPIASYERESGTNDASIRELINFYIPSPKLVEILGIERNGLSNNEWYDHSGNIIFQDPGLKHKGRSFALCKKVALDNWLNEHNFSLVWMIGGEKQLFTESSTFFGRLNFNGFFEIVNNEVVGRTWTEELLPSSEDN